LILKLLDFLFLFYFLVVDWHFTEEIEAKRKSIWSSLEQSKTKCEKLLKLLYDEKYNEEFRSQNMFNIQKLKRDLDVSFSIL